MHGLVFKSFENFIRNSYGPAVWSGLMTALDTGFDGFEPMFHYDTDLIGRIVALAAGRLGQRPEDLLEDFGGTAAHHVYQLAGQRLGTLAEQLALGDLVVGHGVALGLERVPVARDG